MSFYPGQSGYGAQQHHGYGPPPQSYSSQPPYQPQPQGYGPRYNGPPPPQNYPQGPGGYNAPPYGNAPYAYNNPPPQPSYGQFQANGYPRNQTVVKVSIVTDLVQDNPNKWQTTTDHLRMLMPLFNRPRTHNRLGMAPPKATTSDTRTVQA